MTSRAAIVLIALAAAACSSTASDQPDNLAAIQAIQAHRSGQEVTVEGTVASAPQFSRGPTGRHEDFVLEVSSGTGEQQLIHVAHNVDIAPEVPLDEGMQVMTKPFSLTAFANAVQGLVQRKRQAFAVLKALGAPASRVFARTSTRSNGTANGPSSKAGAR